MAVILKDARIVFDPTEGRNARIVGKDAETGRGCNYLTNFYFFDGQVKRFQGTFNTVLIPSSFLTASDVFSSAFSSEELSLLSKVVGDKPYVAIGTDEGEIVYVAPVEAKVEVEKKLGSPLRDLKAFETPTETKKKLMLSLIFPYFIRTLGDALTTPFMVGIKEGSKAEEESDKLKEELKVAESILQDENEIKPNTRLHFLASLLHYFSEVRTFCGYGVSERLKEIKNFSPMPPEVVLKLLRKEYPNLIDSLSFCVFDPQAGSGDHAKILEEFFGKGAVLTGFEIRGEDIKYDSPSNKVFYGTNFIYAVPFLKREVEKGSRSALKNAFFFINPPFSADRFFEKHTLEVIPKDSVVVGILPNDRKLIEYMKSLGYNFTYTVVPAKEAGYDHPSVPDLILFIGERTTEQGRAKYVEYKGDIQETLRSGILKIGWFSSSYLFFAKDNAKEVVKTARKIAERAKKWEKEIENYANSVSLEKYTLKEQIKRGAKVIPDMRFYGNKPLKNIYEVINNVSLLTYYKEVYPRFFKELLSIAEELDIPVPEISEREIEYTTTDNLGITKFKYVPKRIKATEEVLNALEDVMKNSPAVRGEDLDVLEKIKNSGRAESVVVKVELAGKSFGGENIIGYTPVIALLDSIDRELACIRVDVAKFYDELLNRGIIKLNCKLAEPDNEIKLKLLTEFTKHLLWIQKETNFNPKQNFVKVMDLLKKIKNAKDEEKKEKYQKELSELLRKEAVFNSSLFDKFFQPYSSVVSPEKEVTGSLTSVLKSRGIKKVSKKSMNRFINDIVSVYKQSPYRFFFLNKEEMEELVRKASEEFVRETGLADREGIVDDVYNAVWDGLAKHYSIYDKVLEGAAGLSLALYLKESIRYYLAQYKKGNKQALESAWASFNNIMSTAFGIKRHQLNEAVRLMVKAEKTGEKGHLLGWEMRSGKTLTMALMGYFNSLLKKKDTFLFPRSGNMNDVIVQVVSRLPVVVPHLAAYGVSTVDLYSPDKDSFLLPAGRDKLFPNLLSIISSYRDKRLKELIVGGGEKIDELLKSYSYEMEKLMDIAAEKLKEHSPEELIGDEKYSFFLDSPYKDEVKVACAWYFKRLEDRGVLNISALDAYIEAFKNHAQTIESMLEKDEEKSPDKPFFTFRIMSKSRIPSFNYEVEVGSKEIPIAKGLSAKVRNDYFLTPDREVGEYDAFVKLDGFEGDLASWYLLTDEDAEKLENNLTDKLKEQLEKRGKDLKDMLKKKQVLEINGIALSAYSLDLSWITDEEERNEMLEEFYQSVKRTIYVNPISLRAIEGQLNEFLAVMCSTEKLRTAEKYLPFADKLAYYLNLPYVKNVRITGVRLSSVPIKDKDGKMRHYRLAFSEIKKDNPNVVEKETVAPVTDFYFSYSYDRLTEVNIDVPKNSSHPSIIFSNSANNVHFFVRKNYVAEKSPAVIIDEIDESVTPSSNTYLASYYLAKNGSLRVGATGTPTSGYPETVMSLMGIVSGYPYDTIVSSIGEIVRNFSTYSIKTDTIGGIFVNAVVSLPPVTADKLIYSLRFSDNLRAFLEEFESVLSEENYMLHSELRSLLNSQKEEDVLNDLAKFKSELERAQEKAGISFTADTAVYFLGTYLSRYVKRTPGTFDPVGFVSSLQGASVSFNTRENLKKEFLGREVKERIEFDDEEAFELYEKYQERGDLTDAVDGELFALGTEYLRKFYDETLPKESQVGKDVFESILLVASVLKNQITKTPEVFAEKYGFSPKEVKTLAGKTLKSLNDDVVSMTKEYLYSNQNWSEIEKKYPDERKLRFFNAFLKELAELLDPQKIEVDEDKTVLKTDTWKDGIVVNGILTAIIPSKVNGDKVTFLQYSPEDGKYYPARFSQTVPINSPLWKMLKEEGVYSETPTVTVKLNYFNTENDSLVDSLTNAGYQEKVVELVNDSKSFLLTSSRVLPLVARFYDTLAALVARKKENPDDDTTVQVLVRVTSPEMKRAVDTINREVLEKKGIFVKGFTDNASLDVESQKWKKIMERGDSNVQLIVVAPDKTIARGVDLSHLDEIVYAGVSQSGKTATQLFARIFSVEKHEGKINIFGKPLAFWRDKITPSLQFSRTVNTYEKYRFIKDVMGGTLASIAEEYAQKKGLLSLSLSPEELEQKQLGVGVELA